MALPQTFYVTLGKFLHLCVSQFPLLEVKLLLLAFSYPLSVLPFGMQDLRAGTVIKCVYVQHLTQWGYDLGIIDNMI